MWEGIKKWMDEGYNILIKVPETLGKQAVRIIVSLHALRFWKATLSRDNLPQEKRRSFIFIADEPQSWLGRNADIIDDIFSKARKYHFGFICLFQSVKQIQKESTNLLDIMLDNKPDLVVFNTTGSQLKRLEIEPQKTPKFHFIFKSREEQFVAKALKPVESEGRANYKKIYNKKYGAIEREIQRRYKKWENINMEGKKSKSQKNGSKTSVNQSSPKETKKSSNSYTIIE